MEYKIGQQYISRSKLCLATITAIVQEFNRESIKFTTIDIGTGHKHADGKAVMLTKENFNFVYPTAK